MKAAETTHPAGGGGVNESQQPEAPKKREFNPNFDGYTPTWTDQLVEKPMLISDYPEGKSFYDFFFNLESNGWTKFRLENEINDATIGYQD